MSIRCGQKRSLAFPSCGPIKDTPSKEKKSLTTLPNDAQILVLSSLSPREQRILSKTCQQFQLLISNIVHNQTFLREVMNLPPISGAPTISTTLIWQRQSSIRSQPVCLKAFHLENHFKEMQMLPNGREVLCSGLSQLILLDLQTGHSRILDNNRHHSSLHIISGGSRALSSVGNTVMLWDLKTGVALRTFTGAGMAPKTGVTVDETGVLFSTSAEHILKLWNIETGECLQTFEHDALVYDIKIIGKIGAVYCFDNTVTLWNLETGEWLRTLDLPGGLLVMEATPNGRGLVIGFANDLKLLDLETGNYLVTFAGHSGIVHSLRITSDGRVLSCSEDRTVRLWSLATGEVIHIMAGHTDTVYSLQINSDETIAFSGAMDGVLRQWDLETGACLSALPGDDDTRARYISHICDMQLSGTRLLTGIANGLLKLWEFFPLPEERISAAARIAYLSNELARAAMNSLPQFVQNDLQEIQLSLKGLERKMITGRSLDIYNIKLALPDIIASLQRAKDEPIFLTDAIQRVAYLQPRIQNLIYRNLGDLKVENGTLEQSGSSIENAFLFEIGSTLEERIESIQRTLERL